MAFTYKTVLMIGCTAGLGLAMAERMIENGSFVIGVGRRKDRLDAYVAKHGPGKAAASQFDITDLDGIEAWVKGIIETYPSLDCVVLNSGIQRALNFAKPAEIDLGLVQKELSTNYTSYIALMKYLLPHLQAQAPKPTALIAVSSGLALVPIPRCANYCATKSALHSLIWSMRAQLAHDDASRHIRVVEIIPPAVRTELHGLQDDLRAAGDTNFGLSIDEFLQETWAGLTRGDDEIPIGPVKDRFAAFEDERRERFDGLVTTMLGQGAPYSSVGK
ncbi:Uu.00g095750.m01.CDS01 [Anthostomella pinea]|uniref:Uu.00g095750.m01.CDS01 n=1 Tax=Anthostomella pinea TaxID=933095 RepID=A0AAI8VD33_9PEZI|nr:Uu.00g095750.m01.CDS01 [Anthostomella pinea]